MSFKERVIFLGSLGFGIGVLVGTLITAITATLSVADGSLYICSKEFMEAVGDPLTAYVIQTLASGLFGAGAMGGSVVYSIEEWSVLKCTVTHYIPVMVGYYAIAFFLRWFTPGDTEAIVFIFIMMTIAYMLIWLINYLSYRLSVRRINQEIRQMKSVE